MDKSYLLIFLLLLLVLFRFFTTPGSFKSYDPEELERVEIQTAPFRDFLSKQAATLLPQPQAALLSGMVVGVKEDLPAEFKRALRNTSTIHIVVVSGQNLTLLSGFILGFAPLLGRKKTIVLSLIISFGYAVLTGLQVPVVRAFLMIGLASASQLINREVSSMKVLVLTALVMLVYNPSWLFSISFQLSFLATIGVVVLAPEIIKGVKFLPEFIKIDLFTSFAAQLMTIPIIAIHFHQLSLIGVLVNALILWTVPIVMIAGAFALLTSLFSSSIAHLIVLIPMFLLTYFVYVVELLDQKWGHMYIPKLSILVWLGYYALIASTYFVFTKMSLDEENDDLDMLSLEHVSSKAG